MRRSARRIAGSALVLALASGAAAGWLWWRLLRPYRGFAGGATVVDIPSGTDARHVLELLARRGVLADATLSRLYLVHVLGDPPLKAGEYRFVGAASAPRVLAKLTSGEVVTHSVTLVEGLTLEETAHELAEAGFGDEKRLLAAMRDPSPIADLDPQAATLEGYLFPETYAFARGTAEAEIVATLVATFRRRYGARLVAGGAPADPHDVVTLASIVEKEARLDGERPLIAAVYRNRLERGMALYADPTIIYALKRRGTWDGNLRRPDLELDSPYNTYRRPGLPPGPICSPGLASLEAAARPADVPYLYFVSRNDGSHAFATTLAEHNRNVERWQVRYWRERWRRDGADRARPH